MDIFVGSPDNFDAWYAEHIEIYNTDTNDDLSVPDLSTVNHEQCPTSFVHIEDNLTQQVLNGISKN